MDAIPSVGVPSYPFGFYAGAWNYIKNGRAITEEGYLKVGIKFPVGIDSKTIDAFVCQYPGKAFKVAFANRWLVVLNGQTLIEDVRKAPDESLSVSEATNSVRLSVEVDRMSS